MRVCGLGLQGRVCVSVHLRAVMMGGSSRDVDLPRHSQTLKTTFLHSMWEACRRSRELTHAWLMSPCMCVGYISLYVSHWWQRWLMWDIFQPLTKLSSLKIRGQLYLLLSMQISQCSRLRRCNAAVFWNHDRTADSELRFLRVLANSRRMDRTTFSDVHTRCELKLQANMCFLSAAQFKSFPGGLTLIDPLSPQSKLKCGKAAFSFYEPHRTPRKL